jgi:alpha-methylacyl-CoA racemase
MPNAWNDGSGPLERLRVVELGGIGPTPYAGMLLADMGADVLRVERPQGSPTIVPAELDVMRRGKRSVTIDLRRPEGVDALLRLAGAADVFLEGYRPGVTERLGIGPAACWDHNPSLIYGRMTGWGQDGPWAAIAGHDIAYIAITGALGAIGQYGQPPAIPLNLLGDFGGGSLFLVMGVLAALHESRHSGKGQVVDAAIVDGAACLLAPFYGMLAAGQWQDRRGTNLLDGGRPWYGVYETADGQWMAVGAIESSFYDELVTRLGIADTVGDREDPAVWPALRKQIADTFRQKTLSQWSAIFEGSDGCVAPILDLHGATRHPQMTARQAYIDVGGVTQPAPAPRFSRTPSQVRRPPPPVGAHSREALSDWGINDVDDLIAAGALIAPQ